MNTTTIVLPLVVWLYVVLSSLALFIVAAAVLELSKDTVQIAFTLIPFTILLCIAVYIIWTFQLVATGTT